MPRKRAPGAGRKPAGPISGKLSNFSTRITNETRIALEAQAGASGQSISQVAERMIRLGLETVAERERSDPTQALAFFIAELAEGCSVNLGDTDFPWNKDWFVFDALAHAIQLLLKRLRPSDSALSQHLEGLDELDREWLESPREWAKYVFKAHWDEAMNTDRKFHWAVPFGELPLPKKLADPAGNELYESYSELLRREYRLERFRREFNLKARYPRQPEGEDQ
jgi:hypothetical protein